jgi:hypothetical protein
MASGDVNGDGKQDVILTLADTDENVDAIVLLGNGDGTFQAPSFLTLQSGHRLISQTPAIVVQDFDSDGYLDLIFGNGEQVPAAQTATGTYSFTVVASSGSVKTHSAWSCSSEWYRGPGV